MKASDARAKIEAGKRNEARKAEEYRIKRQGRLEELLKSVDAKVKEFRAEIDVKIEEELKKRECDIYLIYKDEELGYDYLKAVSEKLVKKLIRDGFKVEDVRITGEGGTIYEGLMNPEAVGWEYSWHSLKFTLKW